MTSTSGRRTIVPLTNKSGGGVIAGDVVVVDTANNDAFTTSTAGAVVTTVGVVQETIASNAVGRVALSGYVALVNVNASVTRGNYGKTHTVAKQATDAGASRTTGTFCQFLTGGTTPDAILFGYPDNLAAPPGAETWETAVAALSGKVHRWKFEEASGDFNDEISTLDLIANGSITYSVAGPLGNGVSFTGGFAESSGLGSIPTGDAERCILIVWKKTAVGTSALLPLFSYGANSSRALFQLYGTSIAVLTFTMVTDSVTTTQAVGDGEYHISAALHNDAGNAQSAIYQDGILVGLVNGGALNTSAANNFHIAAEYDDTDPSAITVTDCIVFNRWVAKWELDRLYAALRTELA